MIDNEGFRSNVGMIVSNHEGKLLWAKRVSQQSWQFPQGGVNLGETPDQAMYRELYEEIGLKYRDVRILGQTKGWLKYRLPQKLLRRDSKPLCVGQKQKWYLLKLTSSENKIAFDRGNSPEFDGWDWVSWWYPLEYVISFKKEVYREALSQLLPFMCNELQRQNRQRRQSSTAVKSLQNSSKQTQGEKMPGQTPSHKSHHSSKRRRGGRR
ncbi:MAG: RNA pyrophosphohydrolase [Pseudomonadota bacterium]